MRRRRDRRRVTRTAASVGSATNSSESTPASAASAAIASRAAFWGRTKPPSHLLTVAKETPRCLASCACVRSRLARMVRSVVAMVCISVIYDVYQI